MDYGDWILQCLGVYGGGAYLDELAKDFGVEADEEENDMLEDIKLALENKKRVQLGNLLAMRIFHEVIGRAEEELGASEIDFDYYCNGTLDTWITCKDEQVYSWEDIEKLYQQNNVD